nr:hypothetical protein [Carnobacterium pleistocenium]
MKLTRKEKSKLIVEGFITIGLILILYYAAFVILNRMLVDFRESSEGFGSLAMLLLAFEAIRLFHSRHFLLLF